MVEMNNKPYLDKSISLDDQLFAIYSGVTHLISDPQNFGDISNIPVGTGTNTGGGPMSINQLLTRGRQDFQFNAERTRIDEESARNNQIADQLRKSGLSNIEQSDIDRVTSGVPVQQVISEKNALQNHNNKLPTETFEQWQARIGTAPAVQAPVPTITSISPNPVPVIDGKQWVTINGTGFVFGLQIILRTGNEVYTIPITSAGWVNSTQVKIYPNFTAQSAQWTVQAVNPNGQQSNMFSFPVTATCAPNWQTGPWGTCVNGLRTRTVTDTNNCGTTANQPATSQSCPVTCIPNWFCTGFGSCLNGQQTRNCTDTNNCGATTDRPSLTQSCPSQSPAPQTLYVSLSANQSTITADQNVTLTANVSGTAQGTINYTFYCNRSDSGINITTPNDGKFDGVSATTKTKSITCSYPLAGTYTAKVITEQGSAPQAEARVTINITSQAPTLEKSLRVELANQQSFTTRIVNLGDSYSRLQSARVAGAVTIIGLPEVLLIDSTLGASFAQSFRIAQDHANRYAGMIEAAAARYASGDISGAKTSLASAQAIHTSVSNRMATAEEIFSNLIQKYAVVPGMTGKVSVEAFKFSCLFTGPIKSPTVKFCQALMKPLEFGIDLGTEGMDKAIQNQITDIVVDVIFSKLPIPELNNQTLKQAINSGITDGIQSPQIQNIIVQLLKNPEVSEQLLGVLTKAGVYGAEEITKNILKNININASNLSPISLPQTLYDRKYQLETINSDATYITTDPVAEVASKANEKRDLKRELQTNNQYISPLTKDDENFIESVKNVLNNFITYGTITTKSLGAGERAGVVSSFQSAFGKLPQDMADWQDVIKIAIGRWPTQRNETKEKQAEQSFKVIYKRAPNRDNPNDNVAVTVMAYGLRPNDRNLASERAAIRTFRAIFGYRPAAQANHWDIVRAIAYSGAKR